MLKCLAVSKLRFQGGRRALNSLLAALGFLSPLVCGIQAGGAANPPPQENVSTDKASPEKAAQPASTVRITFLPPPMEGTISLGVFDRSGKLVRTLQSEANSSDFTVGLNGLITFWDGKDGAGQTLPAGKYRVRGMVVGDLEVSGEEFHCNDWVEMDESPRPVAFRRIKLVGNTLELIAVDRAGRLWRIRHPLPEGDPVYEQIDGETGSASGKAPAELDGEVVGPTRCEGREGTRWGIEKALGETVVAQFDARGELVRRLNSGAGEPMPVGLAASSEREEVFLLEQDGERWRVRGLKKRAVQEGSGTGSVWETFWEKNRRPSRRFQDVAMHVGRVKPFAPEAQVLIKSQQNSLLGGSSSEFKVEVGIDSTGSFLRTSDGLLLRRLTETGSLLWAVLGRESRHNSLVLLQSDGAVVEEFRLNQPGAVMSFDAGEYLWPPK